MESLEHTAMEIVAFLGRDSSRQENIGPVLAVLERVVREVLARWKHGPTWLKCASCGVEYPYCVRHSCSNSEAVAEKSVMGDDALKAVEKLAAIVGAMPLSDAGRLMEIRMGCEEIRNGNRDGCNAKAVLK